MARVVSGRVLLPVELAVQRIGESALRQKPGLFEPRSGVKLTKSTPRDVVKARTVGVRGLPSIVAFQFLSYGPNNDVVPETLRAFQFRRGEILQALGVGKNDPGGVSGHLKEFFASELKALGGQVKHVEFFPREMWSKDGLDDRVFVIFFERTPKPSLLRRLGKDLADSYREAFEDLVDDFHPKRIPRRRLPGRRLLR